MWRAAYSASASSAWMRDLELRRVTLRRGDFTIVTTENIVTGKNLLLLTEFYGSKSSFCELDRQFTLKLAEILPIGKMCKSLLNSVSVRLFSWGFLLFSCFLCSVKNSNCLQLVVDLRLFVLEANFGHKKNQPKAGK